MTNTRWRVVVVSVAGLLLAATLPAQAAYINFTGSEFLTGGPAGAGYGCDNAFANQERHCYASFSAGSTTTATLWAVVPQDMPYAGVLPRVKCTFAGYSTDVTSAGNSGFTFQYSVDVQTTGTTKTATKAGTNSSAIYLDNATAPCSHLDHCIQWSNAPTNFSALFDDGANQTCGMNATCIGKPLRLNLTRVDNDAADTALTSFNVIAVVCEY